MLNMKLQLEEWMQSFPKQAWKVHLMTTEKPQKNVTGSDTEEYDASSFDHSEHLLILMGIKRNALQSASTTYCKNGLTNSSCTNAFLQIIVWITEEGKDGGYGEIK